MMILKKITSSFNLNLIKRIKNELNIDISINDFYHEAIYNEDMGRIEMYLVSNKNQDFFIDDNIISLKNGEKIHTENSYKYSIDDFINLVENVGYKISEYWTDSKNYFSIFYFKI